jgi:hypothetical protein
MDPVVLVVLEVLGFVVEVVDFGGDAALLGPLLFRSPI